MVSRGNRQPPATAQKSADPRVRSLDGVRGLAILLVMLHHFTRDTTYVNHWQQGVINVLQSGWIGVDVFFVLSGFLITGILLRSKAAGEGLRIFYARRVLRIFPLYFGVLIVVFLVLPHILTFDTPGLLKIQRNQYWLWLYITNFAPMYFDSDWLHLHHLWSLAVEEQFYIIWPLLVMRLNTLTLKRLCIGFMVVMPLVRGLLILFGINAYECRADNLAAGSLLALILSGTDGLECSRFKQVAALAGLGLLTTFLVSGRLDAANAYVMTIGCSMIGLTCVGLLLASRQIPTVTKLLENRFLCLLGRYSYGLYVYHFLLLSWLASCFPSTVLIRITHFWFAADLLHVVLEILIVLPIAMVSYELYETWFLRLKGRVAYTSSAPWSPTVPPAAASTS